MKTPGRYLDYPAAEYHADPALGSSLIRAAADESVAHALVRKFSSKAMERGDLTHTLVLEPEKFEGKYVVPDSGQCQEITKKGTQCSKPAVVGASTCAIHGGAEEAAEWLASMPEGTVVVSQAQVDEARAIAEGIKEGIARLDKPYCDLLEGGDREVSYYATAELISENPGYRITTDPSAEGIAVHCRVDIDHPGLLVDLKNVGNPGGLTDHGFARVMASRGLCVQAALYDDIVRAVTGRASQWAWLAAQPIEPYAIRLFNADADDIDVGRWSVNVGLRRWAEYRRNQNQWADWPVAPSTVRLPQWAIEE